MSLELSGKPFIRSTNLYGDPVTLLSVYGYDAGDHADSAICEFIKGRSPRTRRRPKTWAIRVWVGSCQRSMRESKSTLNRGVDILDIVSIDLWIQGS
jgi:hypothetical protein